MADRIANFANNWSSVLDAEMGPTALTAVVAATTDAPSSPCYLVIDLEDPAKREYIWFNDTFTATDFVTLSTANRYLTGSAAGSGITHAVGATIIAITPAQALEDIHDRIDADRSDYDAHAHSGVLAPIGHTHTQSVLDYDEYAPGGTAELSLTTSYQIVETSNLAVTFTAPTSGNVLIRVTALVYGFEDAKVYFGLTTAGSTTPETGSAFLVATGSSATAAAETKMRVCYTHKLTGLSGSTTVKLLAKEDLANGYIQYGGERGPITMEAVQLG